MRAFLQLFWAEWLAENRGVQWSLARSLLSQGRSRCGDEMKYRLGLVTVLFAAEWLRLPEAGEQRARNQGAGEQTRQPGHHHHWLFIMKTVNIQPQGVA